MPAFASRLVFAALFAGAWFAAGPASPPAMGSGPAPAPAGPPTPVLVELFTSEGCSSCPPADGVLSRLVAEQPVAGAEVIALGFHVDYWNELGWVDLFSAPAFTERQNEYAAAWRQQRIYTPQMVVDGATQFIGSDWAAATRAIAAAASAAKVRIRVQAAAAQGSGDRRTALTIELPPSAAASSKADVLLAITEDGLVSDVRRGENANRRLAHAAVVRSLERVASVGLQSGLATTRTVTLDRRWHAAALKAVVVVQDARSRRVLGAAVARLP